MLFLTEDVKTNDLEAIQEFFNKFDTETETVEPEQKVSCVSRYITSLVSEKYQQSIEDIANTKTNNKIIRKKSLQQVMQESFFYGANRFGNNFIA